MSGGDASPDVTAPIIDGPGGGDAAVDSATDKRCRGAFESPQQYTLPKDRVKSVRGTASGAFLVSWDSSPDDVMSTATLTGKTLDLVAPNPFGSLGGAPFDETSPTSTGNLNFVIFASNRAVLPDGGDGGTGTAQLWSTTFGAGGYGPAKYLGVEGFPASQPPIAIGNPYLVGTTLYFDSSSTVSVGELDLADQKVTNVAVLVSAEGTHPVVSSDKLEIFTGVGAGIQLASRGDPARGTPFKATGILAGSAADYPTWISDDACHLYAIRTSTLTDSAVVQELWVYDRKR